MSSSLPPWQPQQPPPVPVRRFTVEEYRRLGEVGVLTEDDRVELLEGWIVPKMVHNPPHDLAIELVDEALRRELPDGYRVRIQSSITTEDSEPVPDVAVVRGSPRDRLGRHPEPADIPLVVEVADSSLATDQTTKARLYARAGIPTYWLINLVGRQVEVFADPTGPDDAPRYRATATRSAGETVEVTIGERRVTLSVADLLP